MVKYAAARFRRPRLGTQLLILMSLALLVTPWLSYRYLQEMEALLIQSQSQAQLLTAEGISTLLNGRKDLFHDLPLTPEGYENLLAHQLQQPVRLDARNTDWGSIRDYTLSFSESLVADDHPANRFDLLLGEHRNQLYAFVSVTDDHLVYRDRNILRLDASDHLRLTFTGQNGDIRRLVITMTEPGVTAAYDMDTNWQYAVEGPGVNQVQGFMVPASQGYDVEFRLPLSIMGSTRQFGLDVVDVDDPQTRTISSIVGTLPSAGEDAFGLVVLKSPEVVRIVQGLGYAGARIQVIDTEGRIRAEVGGYNDNRIQRQEPAADNRGDQQRAAVADFLPEPDMDLQGAATDGTSEVIRDSLKGASTYRRTFDKSLGDTIIAAHPIIAGDEILGTVVIAQSTDRILQIRRAALERIVGFSTLSLIVFVLLILGFSVHLAGRIRRLGAETTNAIDRYGRLRRNALTSETAAGDEIGDLARSISDMLSRLHQHNQFLENMPRTLRHEINNPLNTLSTSLQNLEGADSASSRAKYLSAAKRGVLRIGMIVQNLADAANLEEALKTEELETIDVHELLDRYLNNCRAAHQQRRFQYRGTHARVLAQVADYRIEQMLDKLIDNAVDFSPPGSTIHVSLSTNAEQLVLTVTNSGPLIAADIINHIFESMVSSRPNHPDNRLHFGMGLYVVRVIAEHHGGSVSAHNLIDGSGVAVQVTLPLHLAPGQTTTGRAALNHG